MTNYVFLGVDPGITSAIAMTNLNGKVLKTYSSKKLDEKKMIERVIEYGTPILVATDVKRVPDLIEKLSGEFGAKTYSPERDLREGEKRRLVEEKEMEEEIENDHERDALASILHAIKNYKPLFEKIESELENREEIERREEIKRKIIQGESKNIKEAMERKEEKVEEKSYKEKKRERETKKKSRVKELEKDRKKMRKVIDKLKEEKRKLEYKLEKLEKKLKFETPTEDKLKKVAEDRKKTISSKEKVIREKKIEVGELKNKLKKIKKRLKKSKEGYIHLCKIESLSEEELSELDKGNFKDGLIVGELTPISKESISKLKDLGIRYILYQRASEEISNELKDKGFELISLKNSDIDEEKNFVRGEELESESESDYEKVKRIVDKYKQRKR